MIEVGDMVYWNQEKWEVRGKSFFSPHVVLAGKELLLKSIHTNLIKPIYRNGVKVRV